MAIIEIQQKSDHQTRGIKWNRDEKKVKMTEQGKKNFVYEQKSTETSLIHRIK